ncbi:hypothetical protein ACFV4K_27390, partial [Nocardia sp. NPDC059764]|uniref:hypothetical protein n=1 Tax=Nocardia sp. NPDC059764 TaxID=3346939 RepID=UPI00365A28BE
SDSRFRRFRCRITGSGTVLRPCARAKILAADAPRLVEHRSPWVVGTAATDPWVASELAALHAQGGIEFRLDARELMEPAALFRTFAGDLIRCETDCRVDQVSTERN